MHERFPALTTFNEAKRKDRLWGGGGVFDGPDHYNFKTLTVSDA
jgi:hypothetical protein